MQITHVTTSDIARIARRTEQTVRFWQMTDADFPPVVGLIGRSRLFDLERVVWWLHDKRRIIPDMTGFTGQWGALHGATVRMTIRGPLAARLRDLERENLAAFRALGRDDKVGA